MVLVALGLHFDQSYFLPLEQHKVTTNAKPSTCIGSAGASISAAGCSLAGTQHIFTSNPEQEQQFASDCFTFPPSVQGQ